MSLFTEALGIGRPKPDVSNFWYTSPPGYAEPIPLVYGRARINSKLIDLPVQPGNAGQNKIKGSGGSQNMVAPMLLALCEGQIQGIGTVWEEKDLPTDFLTGYTVVQSVLQPTPTVPGSGPYTIGTTGGEFYSDAGVYDQTAAVWLTYTSNPSPSAGQYYVNLASPWGTPQPNGVYTFNSAQANHEVLINYYYLNTGKISSSSEFPGGWAHNLFLGTSPSQLPLSGTFRLTGVSPAFGGPALPYPGVAYVANTAGPIPNAHMLQRSFEVYGLQPFSLNNGVSALSWKSAPISDASGADILTDFLSNPLHGVNAGGSGPTFPTIAIGDLSAWRAVIAANSLFQSPVYDTQQPAREHIEELFEVTNSGPFWSEGCLKVVPYSDSTATANGYTFAPILNVQYGLNDNALLRNSKVQGAGQTENADLDPILITRHDPLDAYNMRKVVYANRGNGYNQDWVVAENLASQSLNGPLPAPVMTLKSVMSAAVAQQVAQTRLQRDLYIRQTYEFVLPWPYALLEPMDVIDLSDVGLALVSTPVRLTSIEELDDEQGFAMTAEDVLGGVFTAPIYQTAIASGSQTNFNVPSGGTAAPFIIEGPTALTSTGSELWVGAYGNNPVTWGGCDVWISADGANYTKVGSITKPATIGAVLYNGIANSGIVYPTEDTTGPGNYNVQILSGQQLTTSSYTDAFNLVPLAVVDTEWMSVETAQLTSAGEYTISGLFRALYGSAIASHAIAAPMLFMTDAVAKVPWAQGQAEQVVYVKLPAFNTYGLNTENLADVTAYAYTFVSDPAPNVAQQSVTLSHAGWIVNSASSGLVVGRAADLSPLNPAIPVGDAMYLQQWAHIPAGAIVTSVTFNQNWNSAAVQLNGYTFTIYVNGILEFVGTPTYNSGTSVVWTPTGGFLMPSGTGFEMTCQWEQTGPGSTASAGQVTLGDITITFIQPAPYRVSGIEP